MNMAGELVYLDTCGRFSVTDINGDMYFHTYIDEYTCLIATVMMKEKSETLNNLDSYACFMRTRVYEVETLRTYQGTDCRCIKLKDYLRIKGINHVRQGQDAHAQKIEAEHMTRNLTEMTQTILIDSGLSKD